jgi:thymidylate synthase (FAD)
MNVKMVWITPDAEKFIAYCARVSNPANQDNPDIEGLIKYCIQHKHWSPFQMANVCIEVNTSRAITAQIARHSSLSIQEFSQRYAKVQSFEPIEVRRQDVKNRQNSIDDLSEDVRDWWNIECSKVLESAAKLYGEAVSKGIAKECARMVLPMASSSRMYLNGTVRSWLTYLMVRTGPDTQKEHRDIAFKIKDILTEKMPMIARASGWVTE